jgi:hypothetical protein
MLELKKKKGTERHGRLSVDRKENFKNSTSKEDS